MEKAEKWHSGAGQCGSGGCGMQWSGAHRTDPAPVAIVQLTGLSGCRAGRALEIPSSDQRVQGSVTTKFTPGETLDNLLASKGRAGAPCAL